MVVLIYGLPAISFVLGFWMIAIILTILLIVFTMVSGKKWVSFNALIGIIMEFTAMGFWFLMIILQPSLNNPFFFYIIYIGLSFLIVLGILTSVYTSGSKLKIYKNVVIFAAVVAVGFTLAQIIIAKLIWPTSTFSVLGDQIGVYSLTSGVNPYRPLDTTTSGIQTASTYIVGFSFMLMVTYAQALPILVALATTMTFFARGLTASSITGLITGFVTVVIWGIFFNLISIFQPDFWVALA